MSLGSSLYQARKKSGLSQENVAEKLGVSRQTISKWETDETLPDIRQSKGLAMLYHTTLDVHEHLVNGVGEDVLWGHIFQINTVNLRAPVNVMGHPGRGYDIVQGQRGVGLDLRIIPRGTSELSTGSVPLPLGVDFLHPLDDLK